MENLGYIDDGCAQLIQKEVTAILNFLYFKSLSWNQ